MKKWYSFLTLLSFILFGSYNVSFCQSTTFPYIGASATWTVPTGVNAIFVDAQGAAGGSAGPAGLLASTPAMPGCGGRVQANLAVTPGQVLTFNVGGQGDVGLGYTTTPGGYNGGGSTASWAPVAPSYNGGGGGGKTDISLSGTELIVAGGGGGAGYNAACADSNQAGGNGGGLVGDSVMTCDATLHTLGFTIHIHSGGGSQTAGGVGGYLCCGGYYAGTAGTLGTGGNNVDSGGVGGGGGGGYYGGGGGCWMGGGGGSSYTNPAYATAVTHTQGYNCGNGMVVICILPDAGTISGAASICGLGTTTLSTSGIAGGTWSSSNSAVATIDATGIAYGVSGGNTTVSYTVSNSCGTIAAMATVNVITAGTITGKDSVCVGRSITLSDTVTGGTWSSLITSMATVGTTTGLVNGVTPGTDTVFYTITEGGCTTRSKIPMKVKSAAACVNGINTISGEAPVISIIPNPSPGTFSVALSSDIDETVHFTITSMVGEKIKEFTGATNNPLSIQLDVPAGVYFLSAGTVSGKWTDKIIVTR